MQVDSNSRVFCHIVALILTQKYGFSFLFAFILISQKKKVLGKTQKKTNSKNKKIFGGQKNLQPTSFNYSRFHINQTLKNKIDYILTSDLLHLSYQGR